MRNVIITLTKWEWALAMYIAAQRVNEVDRNQNRVHRDQRAFLGKSNIDDGIRGAAGEQALAKYLGVYWPPSVNTFKSQPDVPPCFQIKATHLANGHLVLRPRDDPKYIFVLVVIERLKLAVPQLPDNAELMCRIVGCIRGTSGRNWVQPRKHENGDIDSWWVPQEKLDPLPAPCRCYDHLIMEETAHESQ